jgi:hypothetical protein
VLWFSYFYSSGHDGEDLRDPYVFLKVVKLILDGSREHAMCLGINEELLERDLDKESGLGEEIGGLGGSLKSELRGLHEKMVEIFDSELRRWDEVVGKEWRISEEKSAASREARSDSALRERTKPPHFRLDGGIIKLKSEEVGSSSSSSNHPIVGKSPDSSTGFEAWSKSPMSKDSAKLKSPIAARDLFSPLVLIMLQPFVMYTATGGLRKASRASVADDNDWTPILVSLELVEDGKIVFVFHLLRLSSLHQK